MTEVNTNLIQRYAFVRNTMESYCALSLFHSKTGTTFMDHFSYEADFEISQAIYTWKKRKGEII